jgi:hypothetical protein
MSIDDQIPRRNPAEVWYDTMDWERGVEGWKAVREGALQKACSQRIGGIVADETPVIHPRVGAEIGFKNSVSPRIWIERR